MHCFCNYAICMCNTSIRNKAYVPRIYACMYAHCVIRIRNMYAYKNYVHVQQLCTCATIMYMCNNYVCVQKLCMRTTIMYAYNDYVFIQQCLRITRKRLHVRPCMRTNVPARIHFLSSRKMHCPPLKKVEMTSLLQCRPT